jgi:hypothetical protein
MTGPLNFPTSIELVFCQAAGWRIALEPHSVNYSRPYLPEQDQSLPELATVLGLTAPPDHSHHPHGDQVIALKGHELRVSSPVELSPFPINALHPLPELIAQTCQIPGLRALGLLDQRTLVLIIAV